MSSINVGKSVFSRVDQIGIVVKDLEKTMKFCEKIFGIMPFSTMERDLGYAKLKTGFFWLGNIQIELIQVVKGKTIHSEFLEEKGEGIHHLGFFVKDIEKELNRLKKEDIGVLERGEVFGVAKFAYLDTEKTLGFILELIQF